MPNVYKVKGYLDPIVRVIRDTLVHHCEKGTLIEGAVTSVVFRFTASEDTGADGPAVKAEGVLGEDAFIFRSGGNGSSFSVSANDDAERVFFHFVMMMNIYRLNIYRKNRGPEAPDLDEVFDISKSD
jgi:hypothetical protein